MQTARGTSLTGVETTSESGVPPEAASVRPRRVGVLLLLAVGVLALDIVSKVVVVARLTGQPPVRLLGGLLTLQVTRNSGAAFSIGTSMTIVFTVIAVGVIVFILRTARRLRSLLSCGRDGRFVLVRFAGLRLVLFGSSNLLGRFGRGVVGFFEGHGLRTHTRTR